MEERRSIRLEGHDNNGLEDIGIVKPGQTIAGRYVIRDVVGRGGMGRIYRVYDEVLGEEVALKTLLPQHVKDKLVLERFMNEARIARSLSHPNIVRVHDIGEADGMVYISMELLKGRSLRQMLDRLKPGQRLPINGILRMFDALCGALDYAHRFTIHRDIKPENVMVLPDGSVKLMDFGISKLKSNPNFTSASVVMGTPHYMSPEQLKNSANVDARADVYSVGVLLYEVITGRTPTALAKPASETRQEVPPALDPIIEKCVQPDPAKRFHSAAELREALRKIRVAIEKGTETQTRESVPANREPVRVRAPWRAVFGVALVLGVLGGAAFGLVKAEQRRQTLIEASAQRPSPGLGAVESPHQQLKQIEELVLRVQELASKAIMDFSAEDQDGVLKDALDEGDRLWKDARNRADAEPEAALAQAWDALTWYLVPIIWPENMVFVPPGPVVLEDEAGGTLTREVHAFFIDEREVSQEAFDEFCAQEERWRWPAEVREFEPVSPMASITYYDIVAFLSSQKPPRRPPTEEQWVRAMRVANDQSLLFRTGEEVLEAVEATGQDTEGDDEAPPPRRVASRIVYAYGQGFAEWTRTPWNAGAGQAAPDELTFGLKIVVCGGHFDAGGGFEIAQPQTIAFESNSPFVGFRGVVEFPHTVHEVERLLR